MNRRAARWRKRRIIYNNDGNDVREAWTGVERRHDLEEKLFARSGGELIDDFLNARSRPLVGTQVDSIWYWQLHGRASRSRTTQNWAGSTEKESRRSSWRPMEGTTWGSRQISAARMTWRHSGRCA